MEIDKAGEYKGTHVPIINSTNQFTEEEIIDYVTNKKTGGDSFTEATSHCMERDDLECSELNRSCTSCILYKTNIPTFIDWCFDNNFISKSVALQLTLDLSKE